jgi:homogentisate 1,2-dioxygenase
VPDKVEEEDYLILESVGPVRIPRRYLNHDGQIRMGSPYSERDFHGPTELVVIDKEEDTRILVKDGPRWTQVTMAHNPFDVVGWDGFVYPFTFNAADFEPITGAIHQPPPIHQTFEIRGYVVCTFAPRMLDYHSEAVKIPWVHDNVEADEVLFYVRGNFGSRRGIEAGSITLHPRGIPHGPHPGTIMASKDAARTEELAVMFDTEHTLELTEQAVKLDDEQYPKSWLD